MSEDRKKVCDLIMKMTDAEFVTTSDFLWQHGLIPAKPIEETPHKRGGFIEDKARSDVDFIKPPKES